MNKDVREHVKDIKRVREILHRLIYDMSSEEYHGMPRTSSSTQLKDLLDDEDVFIKKHILKEIQREEAPAFDVGTYFHTGVLEPHKLKMDCVVYHKKTRYGKEWEKFKQDNAGKAIVTKAQKEQAEGLIRAVMDSPVAQEYLVGDSEVSMFVELVIHSGQIFAPYFGKVLTRKGWEEGPKKRPDDGYTVFIKVRADKLGDTFISDLKSTTGNAKSRRSMQEKISYYNYDLSAALYLDVFSLLKPDLCEFIWIFASKDLFNSKTYRASETNILVGRAKYIKALFRMADCAANNWKSVDYLDVLEPLQHELEYLREKDTDFL